LAPTEAATLAVAISREWHRQRGIDGGARFPDVGRILLHPDGTITFLTVSTSQPDGDLWALLSHLLDVARSSGSRVDGSAVRDLAITMARFTGDEQTLLPFVFWRTAAALRSSARNGRQASHPLDGRRRRRGRSERRHRGLPATELRREIRLLEQQLFEARKRRATRPPALRAIATRLGLCAAASCAVFVLAAASWPATTIAEQPIATRPQAPSASVVSRLPAVANDPAASTMTEDVHRQVRPTARTVRRTHPAASAPRRTSVPQRMVPRVRGSSAIAVLAGGTRGIPWLAATR
jgi:hypothetical protein